MNRVCGLVQSRSYPGQMVWSVVVSEVTECTQCPCHPVWPGQKAPATAGGQIRLGLSDRARAVSRRHQIVG